MIDRATLRGWFQDTGTQNELRTLLDSGTFKRSLELAKRLCRRPLSGGPDAINESALSHAAVEGAELLIDALRILTNPPKEWGDDPNTISKKEAPFEWLKKDPARKQKSTVA